ncbi:hydroxymethylglutaryl-CoA reductase, degradative [uncultured Kordia sp.]|uniref:hydroxymethylglutaryl-CoA reductase, degradative n=1 Tax=uncultured Kordia sp. TaxID=507699 RepID=UPI00262F2696|nr:hydroxymethylglutaryl-CoA reductase, degradative [uncultured Kordia sp.]
MIAPIAGFSKLSKNEKIEWLANTYFHDSEAVIAMLTRYWNSDEKLQKLHDEFIENTITNFYLPLGIAPNFLINDSMYAIPMTIEESSVVAAASKAAKFWLDRGGFKATVLSTEKVGQVHFMYFGDSEKLQAYFKSIKAELFAATTHITHNMEKRGGGITAIELRDKTNELDGYYQLHCTFETVDSMGANFINSCLEQFAKTFEAGAATFEAFSSTEKDIQIVMSILSNYVPNCIVKAEVSCPIEDLTENESVDATEFAEKFVRAIQIAKTEPYRAVTHNKGIMNGIDAVVLATGNDFRAIEAGIHAYAAKDGRYTSLTHAAVENGIFKFWIEIPLSLGTVGGLTSLHPLVKLALEMLGKPNAKELMQIVAVAGLAQNFAAVRSLVTTGIQKGHMKMHLINILNQLEATEAEKAHFVNYFKDKTVTHSAVVTAFTTYKSQHA